jgi:hypothetical protein
MVQAAERATKRFVSEGWRNLGIDRRDALNDFSNLGRQGLENFFHKRGLNGYALANEQIAWWAPSDLAPTGKISFSWPGLSGLRQIQGVSPKRNMHWHFGVTANARIGPTPHVRLKSRLVFTEDGKKPFDDPRRAHRLRRSFAKSWRNPRWRDMMLAFLAWLSEGSTELAVPMAAQGLMTVGLPPIRFSAPVGIDRGAEAEEVEDEGLEEESEIEFEDEDEPDEAPEA